ncbi:MAG: DUF3579 domain-containing protein [Gammaproteobacteria bacterium WSBS_2016_MAG_OTU1]
MIEEQPSSQPSQAGINFMLIKGETADGKKFRPSDWCDRLHSTLRALDADEYEECVEYVHLVNSNGSKGVLIDCLLETFNPMLFKFFMTFVNSNNLIIISFSKEHWESQQNRS